MGLAKHQQNKPPAKYPTENLINMVGLVSVSGVECHKAPYFGGVQETGYEDK